MAAFRRCDGCLKDRLIDGGCELSPHRWLCASCWVKHINRKFKK